MVELPWIAHDAPDRPFDACMWLDDCEVCIEALKREAAERPRLLFCLKTNADRVLVTAERLCEALSRGGTAESLCYVQDDWVREVYVVSGELPPSVQWQSLTLSEEIKAAVASGAFRRR
ncbi:MAG TPA: hypothetical protein VFN68_14510 [Acidimicrobiales bacterium]|nr:hypothetical protein [Acidimicrobiales bacterium]